MLSYMDYVEKRFYQLSHWNEDNFYTKIESTAFNLIDFDIPRGPSLLISSQTSKNTCTSYRLSSLGLANGSISYLYSTRALEGIDPSATISLQDAVTGYRLLTPLKEPENAMYWEKWHRGKRIDRRDNVLYGRFSFPGNALEAMYIRRMSPATQFLVKCVSDPRLAGGGAMTFTCQRDMGRHSQEYLYSTYESLLGFRGLYNINLDDRLFDSQNPSRLSMGMEAYFGLLNKSPGISTAIRYTTQSAYTGTPLTLTVLSNPLMGHISATYAVRTTALSSFASRFDFNVYSYTSDLSLGCEIWRKSGYASIESEHSNEYDNAIKIGVKLQSKTLKLAWEGKFGNFLVNAGAGLDFTGPQPKANCVGLELQFSS